MAAGYVSANNTFIPSFDAGGQLVVAFTRNAKDFPLNQYITITPVKKSNGYYLQITAEQAARVLNTNLADRVWHDSNDMPSLDWGDESFQFAPYLTTRYAFGFRLGWKSVEQADWKILASHAAISAASAMTARAVLTITALLNTSANGIATATATSLGGGNWSNGTSTTPYIMESILNACTTINIQTLGVVGPRDLVLVVSPTLARQMASSAEMHDYLKGSPDAYAKGLEQEDVKAGRWGLPQYLYGVKTVVEDTVQVTSAKLAASLAESYVLTSGTAGNNKAMLLARPGGLTSSEGSTSFSTQHIFSYEEMKVESKDDPDNRRTLGRVVDDYATVTVAPASGYIITGC